MRNYKVEKEFDYRGYKCVVTGSNMGHRCGYVGLNKPTDQMQNDSYSLDVDVHGGITYGERRSDYPVESKNLFWLGFDCAHSCDGKDWELVKELNDETIYKTLYQIENMYPSEAPVRTFDYVEWQLKSLVDQLVEMGVE